MDYENSLKTIGNTGADIDFDPPSLTVPFQQGISEQPRISYKQGLAFKPKFVQYTIDTSIPAVFEFWAPEDLSINPN